MKKKFLFILIMTGLIGGYINPSISGEYKLTKGMEVLIDGKIYPICKDLLKSLNSYKNEKPMVCTQKFNPEFGFYLPEWSEVKNNHIEWGIIKQVFSVNTRSV